MPGATPLPLEVRLQLGDRVAREGAPAVAKASGVSAVTVLRGVGGASLSPLARRALMVVAASEHGGDAPFAA